MFNLTESIAALRDAEAVISSHLLTDEEKGGLLGQLVASVPPSFNRPHIDIVQAALERTHAIYRPATARPTPREQDTPSMAEGPGEGPAETGEGPTEGEPEQAQDAGRLVVGRHDFGATAEAAAQVEGPKASKARKQRA